jgi:ATP-dependent exoDNAse (exonuclease V) alpha subunit
MMEDQPFKVSKNAK